MSHRSNLPIGRQSRRSLVDTSAEGRRDRSQKTNPITPKINPEILLEEFQNIIDELKISQQEFREEVLSRLDKLERQVQLTTDLNHRLLEIETGNSKTTIDNLSKIYQSQRDIERNMAQVTEAIRSFQLILVLAGITKNKDNSSADPLVSTILPGQTLSSTTNRNFTTGESNKD